MTLQKSNVFEKKSCMWDKIEEKRRFKAATIDDMVKLYDEALGESLPLVIVELIEEYRDRNIQFIKDMYPSFISVKYIKERGITLFEKKCKDKFCYVTNLIDGVEHFHDITIMWEHPNWYTSVLHVKPENIHLITSCKKIRTETKRNHFGSAKKLIQWMNKQDEFRHILTSNRISVYSVEREKRKGKKKELFCLGDKRHREINVLYSHDDNNFYTQCSSFSRSGYICSHYAAPRLVNLRKIKFDKNGVEIAESDINEYDYEFQWNEGLYQPL